MQPTAAVRFALATLVAASAVLLSVGPLARPVGATVASAGGATVTGPDCQGDTDTLSWTPPSAGVIGYQIDVQNDFLPYANTYSLPADQTSMEFPVQFGTLHFTLLAATMSQPLTKFATASAPGFRAPQPMNWDSYPDGANVVANGSATVAFEWPANAKMFSNAGGTNELAVTVTASPGGASITSTPSTTPSNTLRATATFSGLTNGTTYTFTSVTSNHCGSSGPSPASAPFTPKGPGALTCFVSGVLAPPAVPRAQQSIQVQSEAGLAAIDNIQIVNGTVDVAAFALGTTAPVVVTATKATPGQKTIWSFDMTDLNGQTRHCG